MTFNSPPHRKRGSPSLITDQTLPDVNRLLVSVRICPPARIRLSAASIPGVRIQGDPRANESCSSYDAAANQSLPCQQTHALSREMGVVSDLLISYSTVPKRASPGPGRRGARGPERAKSSTLLLDRNQVCSCLGALPLAAAKTTRKLFVGSLLGPGGPGR